MFLLPKFLNYSNPYNDFPNIHVSPEQICCLYHYFLIVLNFLDSHHFTSLHITHHAFFGFTLCMYIYNWERHLTALPPAWWSWQAVLNFSHISMDFMQTYYCDLCKHCSIYSNGSLVEWLTAAWLRRHAYDQHNLG